MTKKNVTCIFFSVKLCHSFSLRIFRPSVAEQVLNSNVANPSIGEVSLGASLSMGSGCILESNADNASREPDRESASQTAIAGASLTGSVGKTSLLPQILFVQFHVIGFFFTQQPHHILDLLEYLKNRKTTD